MGRIKTKHFRKEQALVSINYGDRPPGLELNLSVTLDKSFKLSVPKSPHCKIERLSDSGYDFWVKSPFAIRFRQKR